MIIPDRKKAVSVILSKMGGDGAEKSQEVKNETPGDDTQGALRAITEDVMQAFHDKSIEGLMSSLKAFCTEVDSQGDDDSGEPEDS